MKFSVRNPIDEGWYADPEARFYEGKYIIYVTHSLPFDDQHNHSCFVSEDLTHWEKIDNIIDMEGFPWAKCAIWAPTIEEKNGKYYYIFASNDIPHKSEVGGLEIAVSDSPTGPFKALLDRPLVGEFHNGAQPIDAHLFKDDDGTMYLYYGGWGHCNVCNFLSFGMRVARVRVLAFPIDFPCRGRLGNGNVLRVCSSHDDAERHTQGRLQYRLPRKTLRSTQGNKDFHI